MNLCGIVLVRVLVMEIKEESQPHHSQSESSQVCEEETIVQRMLKALLRNLHMYKTGPIKNKIK